MSSKPTRLAVRLLCYFGGFFIMTIGIALSVKSDLGVSPVSSIPYTMTCVWGIEMGKATILFHIVLVLLQILILRKKFEVKNLLQIPVGVVFGYFTTFCNFLASFAPFIRTHIDRPEIRELVLRSFRDFASRNLSRYPAELPVSLLGGVAAHFEALLREALEAEGRRVETIVESPAEGLLKYHYGR